MRQVTAVELNKWFEENPWMPAPRPGLLEEMESEGITFELRTIEDGNTEYPYINTDNWIHGSEESS